MAEAYSKIYIHIVFAVKGRQNLIHPSQKDELYKYITGIVQKKGHKLIRINGMPDHIHILIGFKPAFAISNLVRDIKSNSSAFINKKDWINGKFEWQKGYGAFSYSHSQLEQVVRYIERQEEHHRQKTFREEYLKMLDRFDISFEKKYLFDWID